MAVLLATTVLTPCWVAAQADPPLRLEPARATTADPVQTAEIQTKQVLIDPRIAEVTRALRAELLAGIRWDNIPSINVGTVIGSSGADPATKSDGTLSGIGIGLHGRYDLDRNWLDFGSPGGTHFIDMNFRYGNTTGKSSARADGDGFLTFIQPIGPDPGGAVPFYNADVSSRLTSYQFDVTYNIALNTAPIVGTDGNVTLGIGVGYKHLNTHHSTVLSSFAGTPFDKRDINTADNYLGPVIRLDANIVNGPWNFAAGVYVAPMFRWTGASAFEDFNGVASTRICDSDTGFSFNTGLYGRIGYALNDNIRISAGANFNYHSAVGAWRIPVSLADQPARLRTSSMWSAGINFGIELRF